MVLDEHAIVGKMGRGDGQKLTMTCQRGTSDHLTDSMPAAAARLVSTSAAEQLRRRLGRCGRLAIGEARPVRVLARTRKSALTIRAC